MLEVNGSSSILPFFSMKHLLSVAALLCSCASVLPQPGKPEGRAIDRAYGHAVLLANAKLALSANQYPAANGMFKEAFRVREPWDSYSFVRASVAAYMASDSIQAWTMLRRAIATGATWNEIEEGIISLHQKDQVKFSEVYGRLHESATAEFSCSIDLEQFCLVQELLTADQTLRNIPHDAVQEAEFLKYMGAQDSTIFAAMVRLVERSGWPTFSTIGNLNSLLPLLLMHNIGLPHATERDWGVIQAAIWKAVEVGEEDGYVLAMLDDLFLQRQKQPQLYGTQSAEWQTTPTYYEIEDCQSIDIRRRELGLIPLELDAKRRGFQLPFCYAKKP